MSKRRIVDRSLDRTVKKYEENKRQQQIEGEILLLKKRLLDEGLRRLIESTKPMESVGVVLNVDEDLHEMFIKAKVNTDGSKWWYTWE